MVVSFDEDELPEKAILAPSGDHDGSESHEPALFVS